MAWYDNGTVSVTNGSTTVTGSGTNFIAGAQIGEAFYGPDERLYEIQAIVSATSLTLGSPYLGANQTGQSYYIIPTQSLVADLASQVSTLISDFQSVKDEAGEGKFDDGTSALPGITFNLDQDTGLSRPAANQIGFSTAGVQRALLSSTALTLNVPISGILNVSASGSANGILVEDSSSTSASPAVTVIGKRLDANNSQSFSGKLRLAGNQTNAAVAATKKLGTVAFGGNHTDGSIANILYPASISGISEGTFSNATTMPTGLTFYTGSIGRNLDAPSVDAGTERMRITSTGNVGIGTTAPGDPLSVIGSIRAGSPTVAANYSMRIQSGTADFTSLTRYSSGLGEMRHFAGAFQLASNDAFPIIFATTAAERMRISPTGNVGIGTSSPSQRLDVIGSANIAGTLSLPASTTEGRSIEVGAGRTGDGNSFVDLIGDATYTDYGARLIRNPGPNGVTSIQTRGTGGINILTQEAGSIRFSTSNVERGRFDTSGVFFVGTTSTTVGSDSTSTGIVLEPPGLLRASRSGGDAALFNRLASDGTLILMRRDGLNVGNISVTTTTTSYNTTSDYRLKEDVKPLVGASDRVLSLKPCNFAWKANGTRTDGFIAHEAQAVVPEAVTGEKDGEEMQAIDQSKLVPLLTAALQEALKRIEALEAQLT